mgnify:CR=1 FL=1|tara:strand:+ start:147 stop:317 length:171 start_codon:yes stop_codon:yes gene_type:complete
MSKEPLKQVKLLPMSNKLLDKMIEKRKEMHPAWKVNKQGLVNALILTAAIEMGVEL